MGMTGSERMGLVGLEPTTSRLSAGCCSQTKLWAPPMGPVGSKTMSAVSGGSGRQCATENVEALPIVAP
jgi:hypothetical protein